MNFSTLKHVFYTTSLSETSLHTRYFNSTRIMKKFSVKKGTLQFCLVSSPGPFNCRSNALSSELPLFSQNLFIPIRLRIHHEIFTNFCKSFQSIMPIIKRVYHSR